MLSLDTRLQFFRNWRTAESLLKTTFFHFLIEIKLSITKPVTTECNAVLFVDLFMNLFMPLHLSIFFLFICLFNYLVMDLFVYFLLIYLCVFHFLFFIRLLINWFIYSINDLLLMTLFIYFFHLLCCLNPLNNYYYLDN